jgi:hypothetical protein
MKYGNTTIKFKNILETLSNKFGKNNYIKNINLNYTEPNENQLNKLLNVITNYSEKQRQEIGLKYNIVIDHYFEILPIENIKKSYINYIEYFLQLITFYILNYKLSINAPRPYQIANKYNKNMNPVLLDTTSTPTFPSGHAGQYYILSILFSIIDPFNKNKYYKLFLEGANSRIIAGVHFVEDNEASVKLVNYLMKYDTRFEILNNFRF